ncbi:condensation domain-containing protein, partial [Xenorhabdus sp. IM139775]|uniref:condensation domain-containing protein n=1 Tax=Xenorhabdus sp. IM139775 TaxID=3025876 RepID=UPI00235913F5
MPMSCNNINNRNIKFSLSSTQQVVWLTQSLHPDSPCYHLGSVVLIEGELDEALLIRAFEAVVDRHDALRLRLVDTQELPRQVLTDAGNAAVTIHDFSGHAEPEEQAKQYIRTAFGRPFDLQGELWRFALLRVSDTRWYWQFCCHPLIGDAVTLSLINKDIANIYRRLTRGKEITEAAPSYLDFIDQDRAYLNSPRYRQDQQFWLKRYKNLPPALIQPSNAGQSNAGKKADNAPPEPLVWQWDEALLQRIEQAVAVHELSVLHFIYAVLACYFSRISDTEDIVIGIPIPNRKNARQRHTLGRFSSIIPVGITVSPDDTFLDVMNKTAAELRRCRQHQSLPITEINRLIQTEQKTGRTQLFDITLSFTSIEVNAAIPNATLSYSQIQHGTPFPLAITAHQYTFANSEDAHKPVTFAFHFSPDYLSREEVIALQSRLMVLLEAALTSPETPIGNLPLLPPAERQQLLVDFNATQTGFPQDALIHQRFEAQAAQRPDATAIVFEGQALSYGELNLRANQLAHHLIALGVRPDDRVAICVERGLEMVVGLLAILKAGGAYVPLDPAYPAERLAYMLDDAAPVALLTQATLHDELHDKLDSTLPTVLLDNTPESHGSFWATLP